MGILYNLSLRVYSLLLYLISPFHAKAKLWSDGRKGVFERLESAIKGDTRPLAWFHCASLGEFEQGRAVIEMFKERYPSYAILVTFFSPSGYEVRKNYDKADYIFYLPIDTSSNAKRFLEVINPQIAIFIKYEFWVNYLKELHRRGVKSYVVSAIFRPSQLFFKSYGKQYKSILECFTHIFVQNNESEQLLRSIGISGVTICGDTRFDRVYDISQNLPSISLFEKFSHDKEVFITGSSWEPDDDITINLIEKFADIKFVIAPHELSESKISKMERSISELGRDVVRYTQITSEDRAAASDVIIVDTIGILSKVYRYCKYGYIGGGFGVGIHNTLEAATFGIPLIFGPNYKRFMEAVHLVDIGAATPINDENDAVKWLNNISNSPAIYDTTSAICKEYVKDNIGACKTIIDYINKHTI